MSSALVEQSHGGALQVGNAGNAGGPGRPASLIRERCRGSFEARIGILEQIADGEPIVKTAIPSVDGKGKLTLLEATVSASPNDRLKAIDLLGKYGGIEKVSIEIDQPPQMTETGEQLMERLATVMVPRFAALLARDDRLKMLKGIKGAEIVIEAKG